MSDDKLSRRDNFNLTRQQICSCCDIAFDEGIAFRDDALCARCAAILARMADNLRDYHADYFAGEGRRRAA